MTALTSHLSFLFSSHIYFSIQPTKPLLLYLLLLWLLLEDATISVHVGTPMQVVFISFLSKQLYTWTSNNTGKWFST
jgi:hypothetical protein